MDGVGATTGSIVRVAAWTLFFLFVIGRVVGEKPEGWVSTLNTPHFTEMIAIGDPRGFHGPLPEKPSSQLRIAWIGSSSLRTHAVEGRENREITQKVASRLITRERLPEPRTDPMILSYVMGGQGIYDLYLSLLDALERDPDIVILTLGPFLFFDTHAVSRHPWRYSSALTQLPVQLSSMTEFALFSQPSDWARGLLSPLSPLVRDQADLHPMARGLPLQVAMRGPLKATGEPPVLVQFWIEARERIYGTHWGNRLDAFLQEGFDPTPGNRNDRILDRMLERLHAADVRVLVYVPPVSPKLHEDPVLGKTIRKIEKRMQQKKNRFERPGMTIMPRNPGRYVTELNFFDYVHLTHTGNWLTWLSHKIEGLASGSADHGGDS
jgi:hypothetical protein